MKEASKKERMKNRDKWQFRENDRWKMKEIIIKINNSNHFLILRQ